MRDETFEIQMGELKISYRKLKCGLNIEIAEIHLQTSIVGSMTFAIAQIKSKALNRESVGRFTLCISPDLLGLERQN